MYRSNSACRAVLDREHFKIEHTAVNMAVFVQSYIDDKLTGVKVHYNGVCITHDVTHHRTKHGFMINWYGVCCIFITFSS